MRHQQRREVLSMTAAASAENTAHARTVDDVLRVGSQTVDRGRGGPRWSARWLMLTLGYTTWSNFKRTMRSQGIDPDNKDSMATTGHTHLVYGTNYPIDWKLSQDATLLLLAHIPSDRAHIAAVTEWVRDFTVDS